MNEKWVLTDDDCCQYRKEMSCDVFHFMQVCGELSNGSFGVAKDVIDLRDYSEDEIKDEIFPFGYTLCDLDLACVSDRALVAECIFENHALMGIEDVYDSYDKAAAAISDVVLGERNEKNV